MVLVMVYYWPNWLRVVVEVVAQQCPSGVVDVCSDIPVVWSVSVNHTRDGMLTPRLANGNGRRRGTVVS